MARDSITTIKLNGITKDRYRNTCDGYPTKAGNRIAMKMFGTKNLADLVKKVAQNEPKDIKGEYAWLYSVDISTDEYLNPKQAVLSIFWNGNLIKEIRTTDASCYAYIRSDIEDAQRKVYDFLTAQA